VDCRTTRRRWVRPVTGVIAHEVVERLEELAPPLTPKQYAKVLAETTITYSERSPLLAVHLGLTMKEYHLTMGALPIGTIIGASQSSYHPYWGPSTTNMMWGAWSPDKSQCLHLAGPWEHVPTRSQWQTALGARIIHPTRWEAAFALYAGLMDQDHEGDQ